MHDIRLLCPNLTKIRSLAKNVCVGRLGLKHLVDVERQGQKDRRGHRPIDLTATEIVSICERSIGNVVHLGDDGHRIRGLITTLLSKVCQREKRQDILRDGRYLTR